VILPRNAKPLVGRGSPPHGTVDARAQRRHAAQRVELMDVHRTVLVFFLDAFALRVVLEFYPIADTVDIQPPDAFEKLIADELRQGPNYLPP
jgi:hypothetical protein